MLNIKRPTLLIDRDICLKNIHSMAIKAMEKGIIFRPHFKTHQSAVVGSWFRDEGVTAITVSSVKMAFYFAESGWKDITIAFPVNLLEMDEINLLASKITVNLLIESEQTAIFLSEHLQSECGFFIKIDTGYHRTGITATNIRLINSILNATKASKAHFQGFLTHSGQAYHSVDKQELLRIQQSAAGNLMRLKKHYSDKYNNVVLSVGDTPTCSQLPLAEGINEIRPGNFVFYDVMQFALGSCSLADIAVALICPVVALHLNRREAVIYGGAVHLSKEYTLLPPDPEPIFGLAFGWDGNSWNTAQLLGKVSSLSQEHGILKLTQTGCNLMPGDLVAILPVHSCLTAAVTRNYFDTKGELIETINS